MRVLTRIVINNFQSHNETILDLGKGLNVLYGISDSGKSSVIRAMNWLINNRPLGDNFISWWAKGTKLETSVAFVYSDGYTVRRARNTSDNYYEIYYPESEENIRMSAGNSVPEEVVRILGMGEVNFQKQHDPHFLLSLSSPELTRKLNEYANINDIDHSIKFLRRNFTQNQAAQDQEKDTIKNTDLELEEYSKLDEMIKLVDSMEDTIAKLEKEKQDINTLEELLNSLGNIENRIKRCRKFLKIKTTYIKLKDVYEERDNVIVKGMALKRYLDSLRENLAAQKALSDNKEILTKEFNAIMPKKCPLCGRSTKP
jgi:exonuclease SbcC